MTTTYATITRHFHNQPKIIIIQIQYSNLIIMTKHEKKNWIPDDDKKKIIIIYILLLLLSYYYYSFIIINPFYADNLELILQLTLIDWYSSG